MRFGPKLRDAGRGMIEELEVLFVRQEATKGYQLLKIGEQEDHVFILFKGAARIIIPRKELESHISTDNLNDSHQWLVLGNLKVGDTFGEESAIEDMPNPWTVEVTSKSAEIYKIHRSNFVQHFGGLDGAPAMHLRSQSLIRNNWFKMKMSFLRKMSATKIASLEFRDEEEYKKLNKTASITQIKEIPFKNSGADEQEEAI